MKNKAKLFIIAIMLIGALTFVFAACGGKDEDPPKSPPTPPSGDGALEYKLSEDGSYYIVAGIGTYKNKDVVIPSSYKGLPVKQIGGSEKDEVGFYGTQITSVTVPDSVTVIGPEAFRQCTSLTTINLPDTIVKIGVDAFTGSAFYTEPENRKTGIMYVGKYLIDLSAGYTGDLVIKDGTLLIADRAAVDTVSYGITSVSVPASLKYIGQNAFYNCNTIARVTVADVDAWCKIVFSNEYSNPATVSGGLYYGASALASVAVPEGTVKINDYAFKGFKNLVQITFPGTLTEIGQEAFYGCTALESISVPSSTTVIGNQAFERCTSLSQIELADTLSYIGRGAFFATAYFDDTDNWQNDVLYIGRYLIEAKTVVKDTYEIKANTLGIACNAFYESQVSAVIIPSGVRFIGIYAFYGCNNLKTVSIPQGITSIEYGTFERCTSLSGVSIPASVTVIGSEAFAYCSSLTSVNLANGIVKIGNYAFYECSAITNINLPASVVEIGENAFGRCTALNVVTFAKTEGWSVNGNAVDVSAALENAKKLKNELSAFRWKRS